jgi:hypothetical protein
MNVFPCGRIDPLPSCRATDHQIWFYMQFGSMPIAVAAAKGGLAWQAER